MKPSYTICCVLLAVLLLCTNCTTLSTTVPREFLNVAQQPWNKEAVDYWEAFLKGKNDVDFRNVHLVEVLEFFQTKPGAVSMIWRSNEGPDLKSDKFTLRSKGITNRELLWVLSVQTGLEITISHEMRLMIRGGLRKNETATDN